MKKTLAFLLAVLMLLSALTGCGSKNETQAPSTQTSEPGSTTNSGEKTEEPSATEAAYKDTVIWAQASDVTSMDPHVGKETAAVTVTCNMFSTLMIVLGDSEPQPLLAESYQQLNDKDWEFTIRQGVKFHDGSDLTVEDVKYSLDRAINSNYVSYIVNFIESVEITGENTIVIHCKEPYAPILNNLSMPFSAIVPKAYIEEKGEEHFQLHPIGSGPYKLVEWNPGESVKLEAFEDYFGDKAKTKNLVMKVVPEAAQRVIALETGEVDIAYNIEANNLVQVKDNPDLVTLDEPSMTCYNYFFNLNKPDSPIADLRVRQAICHAADCDLIIETILNGTGIPATSMIAPSVAGYVEAPKYEYDLEKATALMAEAGYADGFSLIMVVNDSQQRIEICQVVQSMLKEINIDVEIRSYEQATYINALNEGEHDMGFSAWITSTGDADYTYMPCYHSTQWGKPGNRSFFANEKADELIMAGRSESDIEKRKEIYKDLNQIIYENCTQLFMCHPTNSYSMSNKVDGFILNKDGYNRLNYVTCLQ